MTIVIVEGVDLSGKTYAIERIAKHFNSGFVLKNAFKPKKAEDNITLYAHYWKIFNLIHRYTKTYSSDLIILDRFYPSQAVYSYLRGKDEMQSPNIKTLDLRCARIDVKLILLDTPIDILYQRYHKRGDEHITENMIEKLQTRYEEFYQFTQLQKMKLNTSKQNWLKKVEEFLK